ncbi:MAG: hypothetical protein ACHQX1_00830 [Candidatus Micrarchaeales archaeon]
MPKNDVEKITEETVAKGGVLVRFYIDMQDKDKTKLQPLMVSLVNDSLMKEPGVVYVYGSIEEPLEKNGLFTTSGTITMLFSNFAPLVSIAFKYAPAGIEILKPEKEIRFKTNELQSILMDLSQISMDYSKFILEKVMKPEELEKIHTSMQQRAELGKKFLDTSKKKEEPKKE